FLVDADIDRLAEEAWAAFGKIDTVMLNCQPSNTVAGDLVTTPDEVWLEHQKAVCFGPLRMMKQLAPKMMARGGGSIVTIISSTALIPSAGDFDSYALAKNSLYLLTRYMAKEWGKGGVRANAFNPGAIVTGGNEAQLQASAERIGVFSRISLGRLGYTRECLG